MLFDYETLKIIWWLLVGALLIGFAIMDGHDMGVCSLLPFVGKDDEERRVIINTIGPHWEGKYGLSRQVARFLRHGRWCTPLPLAVFIGR